MHQYAVLSHKIRVYSIVTYITTRSKSSYVANQLRFCVLCNILFEATIVTISHLFSFTLQFLHQLLSVCMAHTYTLAYTIPAFNTYMHNCSSIRYCPCSCLHVHNYNRTPEHIIKMYHCNETCSILTATYKYSSSHLRCGMLLSNTQRLQFQLLSMPAFCIIDVHIITSMSNMQNT